MPILQDDRFTRGTVRRARHHVSGLHFVLIFASIALLVFARLDHPWIHRLEAKLGNLLREPLKLASMRLEPLTRFRNRLQRAYEDEPVLDRLRAENARLRAENRVLRRRDAERIELARLAKLTPAEPERYATAHIIARGNGPFRHVLTIDIGRANGARRGHPVVRDGELIGHLAWVGTHVARVLLLEDERSRIPVVVGDANIPAIAAGGYGTGPRLLFVPRDAAIRSADRVSTSGAGGVLPLGLRLGVIRKNGPFWHITQVHAGAPGPLVQVLFHEPHNLAVVPFKHKPLTTTSRLVTAPRGRTGSGKPGEAIVE
jgi:rod shape-determining protein MreC